MNKRRFTPWVMLVCVSALAACTSGEGGTAGNTELNVIVPNNESSPGVPAPIDIQGVEYTINCLGNSDTFLDNADSFPDEVQINGSLEVLDGRTDPQGPIPPEFGTPRPGDGAEVWQAFEDLPPGPCTIQLRARDGDDEVICTAQESFTITADTTAKVNLVLICDVSFQAPVGMLDADATFSFVVGNFCPDLIVLNCLDSAPVERQVLPPPNPPLAGTSCQVRFRDGDSTCGQGCDPQSCTETPEGLTCTPGPDPGVSTVLTCDADTLLDCNGDGVPDPSCTFTGDTLGTVAVPPPSFPAAPGPGGFFITCLPPALGGTPGSTATCTAVTTDGDLDCDKTKVVDIACPGLSPCTTFGGDAACQAAAGTVCQVSTCNEGTCDGATAAACCDNVAAPDDTDCSSEIPEPIGVCTGGVCQPDVCTSDAQCEAAENPANDCVVSTCNVGTGLCEGANEPDNTLCGPAAPDPDACVCTGGVETPVDECSVAGDCPNTPAPPADAQCTAAVCNTAGFSNVCGINLAANSGGVCDFSGPGSGDGTCNSSGVCIFTPPDCGNTRQVVSLGCSNGVTRAQSPFPFFLDVTVNEPVFGGAEFDATVSGLGFFPELFLDIAQTVVPGGVDQAILEDAVTTMQIRSGATGPDLQLGPDLAALTPGPTQFCTFPTDQVCTSDADCTVAPCLPPITVVDVPTSTDCCAAGGGCTCDLLGKSSQCLSSTPINNPDIGFCVTGPLALPFLEDTETYTADSTASEVLFGWAEQGVPDLFICPGAPGQDTLGGSLPCPGGPDLCFRCEANGSQEPAAPDGSYAIPYSVFANPVPPIGIRVNVNNALFVPLQCAMGVDGGRCVGGVNDGLGCVNDADCTGGACDGAGGACVGGANAGATCATDVDCASGVCDFSVTEDNDVIMPSPDRALISCPIN